jgi:DNA-binding YbaB/EbfC family protein
MFKGLGNIASILKQAQQFEGRMQELQSQLGKVHVEGSAGGGMITVEATGQQKIVACHIDPTLLASNDQEMLEDLLVAAVNHALEKSREAATVEMQKLTGSLEIPGLGDALSKFGLGGNKPTE